MNPDHTRVLELLRSSDGEGPVGLAELRDHGVAMPSQVVYELQLAGHDIERVSEPSRPGRRLLGYRLRTPPRPEFRETAGRV